MSLEMLVNITPREVRIALLEKGLLQEVFVERIHIQQVLIGNIYKGKITRILPGIQAAFVDIGFEKAGFLHRSDISNDEKDIRDLVKVGQNLLVQVYKEPLGSKGARLTTQIAIPWRYLVFTPNQPQIVVSQKIANETERLRLQSLTTPEEKGGYIFRTAAEGASDSAIEAEKIFLHSMWNEIKKQAETTSSASIVYQEIPLVLRIMRDIASSDVRKIRVDDEKTYQEMREFAQKYISNVTDLIEYYKDVRPIFDLYSVDNEIQKALARKIHLKCGGYLVFDQTEAMTTIDVNTGSYTGAADIEQTILKTNLEAVEVIIHQIRLRNLGGIIIVDFIDMENSNHKVQLMQSLNELLAKDKVRIEVSEISSLGLVQMTRKRTRESLENILCVTCPLCYRRGTIKSLETIAYEIFRELKRSALIFPWDGFLVIAADTVINYLLESETSMIAELEQQLGKVIKLRVERTYMQEQYDILPLSEKE